MHHAKTQTSLVCVLHYITWLWLFLIPNSFRPFTFYLPPFTLLLYYPGYIGNSKGVHHLDHLVFGVAGSTERDER